MPKGIGYTHKAYFFTLTDTEALPNVTPANKMAPGARAIRYPSGRSWVYSGTNWVEEINKTEALLGELIVEVKAMNALLASWNSISEKEER